MHYYLFQDLDEWAGKTMSKEEIVKEFSSSLAQFGMPFYILLRFLSWSFRIHLLDGML